MANPRDVLVLTTSTIEGVRVKRYLKPVSAHIVAGTNLFNDFLGEISDVFGGRSKTYQKQLVSLYNEAIERIQHSAYEIGANCIIGLSIDMDEISGKGKSMFMLTAIGTAVVLEKDNIQKVNVSNIEEKLENVSVDRIDNLRNKRVVLAKSKDNTLNLYQDVWNFITANQIDEVFPFLLIKFNDSIIKDNIQPGSSDIFANQLISYLDALPEHIKVDLLYNSIMDEKNEALASKLSGIIERMNLFDFSRCLQLLQSDNFQVQKRGLRIATYDKSYYNKQDKQDLQQLRDCIASTFVEKGTRSTKKQLLTSKEKEVWNCECGKVNDVGFYCVGCGQDIFGFKQNEMKPDVVDGFINQKIELISEFID
jgi:uncharacterized protein YbjQ (UPF0145 family)